jgi:hypothetical protein
MPLVGIWADVSELMDNEPPWNWVASNLPSQQREQKPNGNQEGCRAAWLKAGSSWELVSERARTPGMDKISVVVIRMHAHGGNFVNSLRIKPHILERLQCVRVMDGATHTQVNYVEINRGSLEKQYMTLLQLLCGACWFCGLVSSRYLISRRWMSCSIQVCQDSRPMLSMALSGSAFLVLLLKWCFSNVDSLICHPLHWKTCPSSFIAHTHIRDKHLLQEQLLPQHSGRAKKAFVTHTAKGRIEDDVECTMFIKVLFSNDSYHQRMNRRWCGVYNVSLKSFSAGQLLAGSSSSWRKKQSLLLFLA